MLPVANAETAEPQAPRLDAFSTDQWKRIDRGPAWLQYIDYEIDPLVFRALGIIGEGRSDGK